MMGSSHHHNDKDHHHLWGLVLREISGSLSCLVTGWWVCQAQGSKAADAASSAAIKAQRSAKGNANVAEDHAKVRRRRWWWW